MLLRRFARDEEGIALLEFAIFVTILLLLVFGAVDFGRALYTANNLTSAAREGARYGATLSTPICSGASSAANIQAIQDTTVARMAVAIVGGTAPARGQVAVTCPGGTAVQVVVTYPFTWLTPLYRLMGWGSNTKNLHGRATFRWEFS